MLAKAKCDIPGGSRYITECEAHTPLDTMDEVMTCNKLLGISLKQFYKAMKS
jgi:hypothetical protein